MSGILDSKKRVIDVIVTQEGKRQLAFGDFRIESYTFTDDGILYGPSLVSGTIDATSKIQFEASNLPQDSITFEVNEAGRIQAFRNGEGIVIGDGQILMHQTITTGSIMTVVSGSEFDVSSSMLLQQSIENFKKLRVISTRDTLFDDDGFGVGNHEIEFTMTDSRPIPNKHMWTVNVNNEESVFNDPRLSNALNFKYLPPINKTDTTLDKTDPINTRDLQLANFSPLGRVTTEPLSYEQVINELKMYEDVGFFKTIKFDPTSRQNNLMLQFFEAGFNQITKLEVIDYGRFKTGDQRYPFAHVFFAGKLLTDDNDVHTFVHLFTLVFEG